MKYVLLAVGVLLVLFVAVILIRTATFRPRPKTERKIEEMPFNKEAAVRNLQALVRCRTVSHRDAALEDDAEFEKLVALLPELYPHVAAVCPMLRFEGRGLLFRWKGETDGAPAVMMAHYDVVPVNEEGWDKPPFEGILEDGQLWGRGTVDTKGTLNAVLTAADELIANGYTPKCDVYFAFSGSEEVDGVGASRIVDWFEEKGITPELVLDEGGAVVERVFPGVRVPCGMIGIAEKGKIDVVYTNRSNGGHASAPKPHTPVGLLSAACCRVEKHPFRCHLTAPVRQMFDTLARHSTFLYRMIFANLWCFGGALDLMAKKGGGDMNALLRTTVAFTCMEGSSATNVIPPEARMVSNIRLNPADTVDSAMAYLRRTVKNDDIELTALNGSTDPSRISRTDVEGYRRVVDAVGDTWPSAVVTPYLMMQCSDSRHYGRISDRVYRFSAMDLTNEERASIHGHNERIRVEAIYRSVEFYLRLLRSC